MKALVIIAVVAGESSCFAKSSSFSFYAYSVTTSANGAAELHCYTAATRTSSSRRRTARTKRRSSRTQSRSWERSEPWVHPSHDRDGPRRATRTPSETAVRRDARLDRRSAIPRRDGQRESGIPRPHPRAESQHVEERALPRDGEPTAWRAAGERREFEIRIAQSRPDWSAFTRYVTDWNASRKGYIHEIGPCIDAAPDEDQARLAYVMARF